MDELLYSALPAKLVKPTLKSLVLRHRLFGILNAANEDHRILWLHAPPGSGKTTLAASYSDHLGLPLLWYRFDEGDHDPAYFFSNFSAAARSTLSPLNPVPAFCPEFHCELNAYNREYFHSILLNDDTEKLLVFDDCHLIQDAPSIIGILTTLTREAPALYRIVMLSRREPPLELLSSTGLNLALLPANTLLFDDLEAKQLAELVEYDCSGPEWPAVLAKTKGWAAALVIQLRQLLAHASASSAMLNGLANEALSGLEEHVKQCLLDTVLPPTLTEAMVAELTGSSEASNALASLANASYLVSRTDSNNTVYEIHPLLRAFLLQQLRSQLNETEYLNYLRRSVSVMERHGQTVAAAELLIQAGKWEDLQKFILTHAKTELAAGGTLNLLPWFQALPDESATDPWLDFWHAQTLLSLNPLQAQGLFARAHAALNSDPMGRVLCAAGVLTAMFFAMDDFSDAPRWLQELAELDAFVESTNDPELMIWVLGCGNVLLVCDSHPALLQTWLVRARKLLPICPPARRVLLMGFLMQHYVWRGETEASQALFGLLQDQSGGNDPFFRINLLNWQAINAFLAAEHQQAYQAVAQATELAEIHGFEFYLPTIFGQEILTALSEQDLDRASARIDQMQARLNPRRRLDQGFLLHLRAGLSLAQNRLPQARQEAEMSLAICKALSLHAFGSLSQHGLAQILIAQGEWPKASALLDRLEQDCLKGDKPHPLFLTRLTQAHGLLSVGNGEAAAEVLTKALAQGRERNYLNAHPFWQPDVMSRLCGFALEANIEPDYVRRLIALRRLKPDSNADEQWPWPVKIRTLGGFRLDSDTAAAATGKKDNKPLQLLQLLVAINPDGVARQVLADALWPDADADAALHAFEVNLQRLRKLIGRTDSLILQSGILRLNRECCWLDLWTVEGVQRSIEQKGYDALTVSRRLMRVWRGDFFPEIEHPNVSNRRTAFSAGLVGTIEQLGSALEASGHTEQAARLFWRAAEFELLPKSPQNRPGT